EAYAGFKPIKPWKNDEHYHDYITLPKYIEVSSNFYQSLIVFLGSYSREYFYGADKKYSLKHVLSTTAGENNEEPSMYFDQVKYYLPNYDKRKGNWPATDKSKTRPS